ncbi:MAG: hypothetical protein WC707_06145 [Candidatus Babeliaceae bacterium]
MKIIEIIRTLLFAFGIAIMMPIIVYWGIHTLQPTDAIQVIINTSKQAETVKYISFFTYLAVGIITIFAGAFIKDNSLSIGFTGGGILNLLIGIAHSSNKPLMNFIVFLFLLLILIAITVSKKN